MELSSPKIKKVLIFSEIERSYILGRNFPSSKNKKTNSEKICYISGNGTFQPQV